MPDKMPRALGPALALVVVTLGLLVYALARKPIAIVANAPTSTAGAAGEPDVFADHPQKRRVRLDLHHAYPSVDVELGHRASSHGLLEANVCFVTRLARGRQIVAGNFEA